jgi:hypothetical protein
MVSSSEQRAQTAWWHVAARRAALPLLLQLGCAKVDVTPLGSTADGRRQFAIICNQKASSDGTCHERAVAACGGSYETQSVSNTGPRALSSSGQLYDGAADRVLLVACNPASVRVEASAADRT